MPKEVDDYGLALSADAKPRLRWTRQLHQCFAEAVSQLGGPDKATPKSVMQIMGIPGITLYHLKSHLQKYRLAKSKDRKSNSNIEDYTMTENIFTCVDQNTAPGEFHNARTMLQFQMEVQRKLQEQLEVQKHLQLRIEAQGKYLQSVVRKAQETLASYNLSSMRMEAAKSELSELASTAINEFRSSSASQVASVTNPSPNADCSTDSCLTCSDKTELNNTNRRNPETSECSNWNWSAESDESDQSMFGPEELDLNR